MKRSMLLLVRSRLRPFLVGLAAGAVIGLAVGNTAWDINIPGREGPIRERATHEHRDTEMNDDESHIIRESDLKDSKPLAQPPRNKAKVRARQRKTTNKDLEEDAPRRSEELPDQDGDAVGDNNENDEDEAADVTDGSEDEDEEDKAVADVIKTYLDARKKGLTPAQIARRIFKVRLPHAFAHRPHSFPFVSGDTFRAFADAIYDYRNGTWVVFQNGRNASIGPTDGEVIFVEGKNVDRFALEVAADFRHTFVLVTHNSDADVPTEGGPAERLLLGLDNYHRNTSSSPAEAQGSAEAVRSTSVRLLRWFALNPRLLHPRLEAVPIGLDNYVCHTFGELELFEDMLRIASPVYRPRLSPQRSSADARPILAYVNFATSHNEDKRAKARLMFRSVGTLAANISQKQYLRDVVSSKFVVSPPGHGVDCHRTWEALFLGAVPIVEASTTLDTLFKQIPSLIVAGWDGPEMTASDLLQYRVPTTSRKLAMAQFWFDRINKARDRA